MAGATVREAASANVRRVCTDSRLIQPGDLFVALTGEKFDGHDFLSEVAQKGAVAVVVESDRRLAAWPECGVIEVTNTRVALGKLAEAYRAEFDLPVIAVGGS